MGGVEMRTLLGTRKYVLNSLRSQHITLQKQVSSIKNTGNGWQGPAILSNSYGPLTGQKLQTGARLEAGSLGLRPPPHFGWTGQSFLAA